MNKAKIRSFLNGKYIDPIKKLLMHGTSARSIAIGIAGAIVIGIFPVLGSTTILCTIFALSFRVNLPLVQLINFSVYPLQLIMLIPLMKLGEMIFGFEKLKYGLSEISQLLSKDILHAILILWNVTMQAIGAWLIIAPLIGLIFFLILHLILRSAKFGKN